MLPQDGGWMGRPGGGRHSAGLGDFDTERTIKDADKVLHDPQMAGMQAHNDFLGGVVRQTQTAARRVMRYTCGMVEAKCSLS
jgi:hypothetical protein